MITCNLMGGLGNQLFEIFTVIAYAIKSKNPFKFHNLKSLAESGCTIRYTYWGTFLKRLKPFLIEKFPKLELVRENGFPFSNISVISLLNKDICLHGYFQSYKYFEEYYSTIYRFIGIDKMKNLLLMLRKLKCQIRMFNLL